MEVTSAAQLAGQVSAVRARASQYATNLFVSPDKLEQWLQWYALEAYADEHALLVLKEDRGLQHLYFAAASAQDLGQALAAAPLPGEHVVTVDLVGRGSDLETQRALFAQHGFAAYTELRRMARVVRADGSGAPADAPGVASAELADVAAIADILGGSLDKLAEQIPTAGEIAAGVGAGGILLARAGDEIAGLLFHETTGQTSLLRHWFVAPAHRDQGVGARLMHAYFDGCPAVVRFLLWVITSNGNAIKRYEHYGYNWDDLRDLVMIRGGDPA